MSTDSQKTESQKTETITDTSNGAYWGGHMVSASTFGFYTVVLGLLGIDKIALRAPLTALLKFIINIFTLGGWWVYDMIEFYTNKEHVKKYGFSTPYGYDLPLLPKGHGYNMIDEVSSLDPSKYKPTDGGLVWYILYVVSCITLPILNLFFAGDSEAQIWKIGLFFLFPIYYIYGILQFKDSGSIEKDGVTRGIPLYRGLFLMDKVPAAGIIPPHILEDQKKDYDRKLSEIKNKQYKPNETNYSKTWIDNIFDYINNISYFRMLNAAGKAADTASGMLDVAATATQAVQKELVKNPDVAVKLVTGIDPKSLTPQISTPTIPTSEDLLKQVPQKGGSLELPSEMDTFLVGSMIILVLGGFAAAAFRKISFSNKADDNEYPRKTYDRNDAPPIPGGV